MAELIAYGEKVNSVFQLIGTLENDITKSVAWALDNCPIFLSNVIKETLGIAVNPDKVRISYQSYEKGKGITDLEITDNELFYIIIEAKRGWILPGKDQLTLYSQRKDLSESSVEHKAIITMSECSDLYAKSYLPFSEVNGIPIKHLSWKRIYEIASSSRAESNNAGKALLSELMKYLGGLTTMQKQDSNWVYVVSLGYDKPENCELSWRDIVNLKNRYFHPVGGNGWPKDPVNYIAFRYDGRLQSIHHVEDYDITKNLHDIITEMPDQTESVDHFVYKLGPAIIPNKVVKTGKIFASERKWAMLDTLLTADTISDACDESKARIDKD